MNNIIAQTELNDIIKIAEARITSFHKERKRIDSYRTVISALINNKVYQYCVDELAIVSEELNAISDIFDRFCVCNKRYFTTEMRKYLDEYKSYLEYATLASIKRLSMQIAIQQLKVNKESKYTKKQLYDMIEEMNHLQKLCLEKAKKVNLTAFMIKKTSKP
jgi:hypothetical protein